MTTAIINTDMNIGPFRIPGNAQNMILNNYAERNSIKVEEIIPEPFKSNCLATTIWAQQSNSLVFGDRKRNFFYSLKRPKFFL